MSHYDGTDLGDEFDLPDMKLQFKLMQKYKDDPLKLDMIELNGGEFCVKHDFAKYLLIPWFAESKVMDRFDPKVLRKMLNTETKIK